MAIPFLAWIFQGIPECIALSALVFSLSTENMPWRHIALVGLIQAVIIYFVRLIPLSFHLHVLIAVISLAYISSRYTQIDLALSYIYSLASVLVLTVLEGLFMYLADYFQIITYAQFNTDVMLRILGGLPHILGILLLAFIVTRKKHKGVLKIFNFNLPLPSAKKGISKRIMANLGE